MRQVPFITNWRGLKMEELDYETIVKTREKMSKDIVYGDEIMFLIETSRFKIIFFTKQGLFHYQKTVH